jgi:hypothetical protein
VDFQVWIADGDKPLLQRIVLTYKEAVGQPQFWADFVNWDLAPRLDDATFSAQIPDGLQRVAFAAEGIDLQAMRGHPVRYYEHV